MTRLVSLPRYALVYIGTAIGISLFLEALVRFVGIDVSSGGTSVIPAILAAMVEGQKRAAAGAELYTSSEAWTAAFLMTLVAMAIAVAAMFGLSFIAAWAELLAIISPEAWIFILGFAGLVTLGCNRFFLTMGYRNQRKVMEKKAQE